LCRVTELNARMMQGAVVLDLLNGKVLVVGYLIEGLAFKSERDRKRRLWDYITKLYWEWESIARELEDLASMSTVEIEAKRKQGDRYEDDKQEAQWMRTLSTNATLTTVMNRSSPRTSREGLGPVLTTIDEMRAEIERYWRSQGHEHIQTNDRTQYVAVRNLGATLSQDAATFPWLFTVAKRICTIYSVFSMDNKPFIIPDNLPTKIFASLAMHVNSRVKIGAFRVNYKPRQVHFSYHFPYSTLPTESMPAVLKTTLDLLTGTYKLYANAFVQLVRELRAQLSPDPLNLIGPAEDMKPEYKSGGKLLLTVKPKATYFTRVLEDPEFQEEKELYRTLSKCEELKEFILQNVVVFNEQTRQITCSITNAVTVKSYIEDCSDVSVTQILISLLKLSSSLCEAKYHIKPLLEVAYAQGNDVRLLLWKLKDRVDRQPTCKQFEALIDLAAFARKQTEKRSTKPQVLVECEDIAKEGEKFICKGEAVKLKSLQAVQGSRDANEIVFIFQVVAPVLSRLPSLLHIKGRYELKGGLWGLQPGFYRVELDLPPVNAQELNQLERIRMLTRVGEALISLHSKGYRCYCINPATIAFYRSQCAFLLCAMHSCTIGLCQWEQLDVRFLAPELVQPLSQSRSCQDVDYAADYYSFALLAYAYLVNPEVYGKYPEQLRFSADNLGKMWKLYSSGERPLILREFEDKWPKTTSVIRMGLEDPELRPTIPEMLEAMQSECVDWTTNELG
jgi:hypothetical protein